MLPSTGLDTMRQILHPQELLVGSPCRGQHPRESSVPLDSPADKPVPAGTCCALQTVKLCPPSTKLTAGAATSVSPFRGQPGSPARVGQRGGQRLHALGAAVVQQPHGVRRLELDQDATRPEVGHAKACTGRGRQAGLICGQDAVAAVPVGGRKCRGAWQRVAQGQHCLKACQAAAFPTLGQALAALPRSRQQQRQSQRSKPRSDPISRPQTLPPVPWAGAHLGSRARPAEWRCAGTVRLPPLRSCAGAQRRERHAVGGQAAAAHGHGVSVPSAPSPLACPVITRWAAGGCPRALKM